MCGDMDVGRERIRCHDVVNSRSSSRLVIRGDTESTEEEEE